MNQQKYVNAIHEAGHAVIATVFGVKVNYVFVAQTKSVIKTKAGGGMCWETPSNKAAWVFGVLAGFAAENVFWGGITEKSLNHSGADLRLIEEFGINLETLLTEKDGLLSEVENVVKFHIDLIKRVADILYTGQTLKGENLKKIVLKYGKEESKELIAA